MSANYSIKYLPIARSDLLEIVDYLIKSLSAPLAAEEILNSIEAAILRLKKFPYAYRVYQPLKQLATEYRLVPVLQYAVFYTVIEQKKTIEIHRIQLMGRDLTSHLDEEQT